MGMYALNMMDIALEIAVTDTSFEDSGTRFYEHFVFIAEALNELGLWNHDDKFFYDMLCVNGAEPFPLKVRSIVGLTPLFAVSFISNGVLDKLPDFKKRIEWFKEYRISHNKYLPSEQKSGDKCILLSLERKDRIKFLLEKLLNEDEFLSQGGIRALSKYYRENPYTLDLKGNTYIVEYDAADSTSGIFGGNSNWRGPVWMPVNYLFIKALQKYGQFYGDNLKVECPKGSGKLLNLNEVADELINRLLHIFKKDIEDERPVHGQYNWFYKKKENKDLVLFYEYFDGDNCRGLGASHQTGWTALIINLINNC
jgi:hypothetical protein